MLAFVSGSSSIFYLVYFDNSCLNRLYILTFLVKRVSHAIVKQSCVLSGKSSSEMTSDGAAGSLPN